MVSIDLYFGYYTTHMSIDASMLNRHLLLQLGDRLRDLRKARGMTAEQLASAAGITRKTLRSVESGDPSPAIGTYLRVMAALGINGELALLVGDTLSPAPPGSAAARSKRLPPTVKVEIGPSTAKHRTQDLLSMALHEEAVRLIKRDPQLADRAKSVLTEWMAKQPTSRSMSLWREWMAILSNSTWQKVMSSTARAQQLRQTSPLGVVVPDEARRKILEQFAEHRKGVVLASPSTMITELRSDQPEDPHDGGAKVPDVPKAGVGA
nr:helix-turn-helix transcriptional regulator [Roseateles saccharophilus]